MFLRVGEASFYRATSGEWGVEGEDAEAATRRYRIARDVSPEIMNKPVAPLNSRNAAVSHSSGREPRDHESTRCVAQPPGAAPLGAWPRAVRPREVKNGGALSAYLSGLTPRAIRFRPNPGLSTILDCLRATIHRDSRRLSGDCSEKDSGPARGSTGKPTRTGATAPDDAMLRTYCAHLRMPAPRSNMRSMDCAACSRRRARHRGRPDLAASSRQARTTGRRAREEMSPGSSTPIKRRPSHRRNS